jgi:hypothetical protein
MFPCCIDMLKGCLLIVNEVTMSVNRKVVTRANNFIFFNYSFKILSTCKTFHALPWQNRRLRRLTMNSFEPLFP